MGFQLRTVSKKNILLVDVGDKNLCFGVIECQNGKTQVTASGVKEMDAFSFGIYLEEMFKELKGQSVDEMILGFSSSVLKAKIGEHTIQREHPEESIGEKEAALVAKTTREVIEKKMKEELSQVSGILPQEFDTQTFRIQETKIDGYPVIHMQGFKGKEVCTKVFATFLLHSYSAILAKELEQRKIKQAKRVHLAEAIEAFSRESYKDGMFLHIASQATKIVVVQNGSLSYVGEFPFGGEVFIQKIKETLGMTEHTASDFQERYARGELSEELRQRVRALLLPEAKQLIAKIQTKIRDSNIPLPSNVWLLGSGSRIPEMKELLEEDEFQELPFLDTPVFSFLFPKDIVTLASDNFALNTSLLYTPLFLLFYARNKKGD